MNSPQNEIAEYAEQARVATEAYLKTYADIDDELAILHKRLYLDIPFVEKFKARFKGVDIERVQYITRPYYEKTKSPELDIRIRTIIEQENPEYAAKMKAEQEKKEEVADILRYLKRKDKDASDTRLNTAKEVKFPRLVELIGEEEAKDYLPLIAYIEEENRKWREANRKNPAPDAADKVDTAEAKPRRTVKTTKKADNGKQSTKQESKKSTNTQSKKATTSVEAAYTPNDQTTNPQND